MKRLSITLLLSFACAVQFAYARKFTLAELETKAALYYQMHNTSNPDAQNLAEIVMHGVCAVCGLENLLDERIGTKDFVFDETKCNRILQRLEQAGYNGKKLSALEYKVRSINSTLPNLSQQLYNASASGSSNSASNYSQSSYPKDSNSSYPRDTNTNSTSSKDAYGQAASSGSYPR